MVTVISRFRVRNGLEEEVRRAFLERPRLVEKAAGFCGFSVLTDASDPSVFLLLTRWSDEECFRTWHSSAAHHQSHEYMPRGLKLDSSFTSLTIGNNIEDACGVQNIEDALEGRTAALSGWLMESDEVFALLLARDGVILARNRAGHRVFAPDPSKNLGSNIWAYLVHSDVQRVREGLSDATGQGACMLLNLADGQQNPITLEVGLVRCGEATVLLGTYEHRHDSNFQNEILKLTNELSVTMRQFVQKNRELKQANETIESMARTDALTGLANRRMLDEAFQREITRAERRHESLSIIMADLDRFKLINDQYGHPVGDEVLALAGAIFGKQLRPYDLAARYGGEEFILLLPGASTEDATGVAERLRAEVEKVKMPVGPAQITVSLGVATWTTGETLEGLVARADAALYKAKNRGRNRVEAAYAGVMAE